MSEKKELKPCPFCGAIPKKIQSDREASYIKCPNCYAKVSDMYKDDLIAKWNTRITNNE